MHLTFIQEERFVLLFKIKLLQGLFSIYKEAIKATEIIRYSTGQAMLFLQLMA